MKQYWPNLQQKVVSTIRDANIRFPRTCFTKSLALIIFASLLPFKLLAQTPVIGYNSPDKYIFQTAITPLTPQSSNVSVLNYSLSTPGSGFSSPTSVAVDAAGDVYVADVGNSEIKRIPAGGGTPVVIGTVVSPLFLAVDSHGNVFVTTQSEAYLLEIPSGSSTPQIYNSTIMHPQGLAVDANDNLYVAAPEDNAVYKIAAGGGTAATVGSGFIIPGLVAVDKLGNIFVYENTARDIKEIVAATGSTIMVTSFSNSEDPVFDFALDAAGNIYVVSEATPGITVVPYGGGSNTVIASSLVGPASVVVDASGNIYTGFQENTGTDNSVHKITQIGGYSINGQLPAGLAFNVNSGVISGTPTAQMPPTNYVVTGYNADGNKGQATVNISVKSAIVNYLSPQTYDLGVAISPLSPSSQGVAAAAYSTTAVPVGTGFNQPIGLAVDAAGDIIVADANNGDIKKIPAGGGATVTLNSGYSSPHGVAVDAAGNIYFTDSGHNLVMKLPPNGGSAYAIGSGFSDPTGVAVDASGNVYVADFGNSAVKMIPAGGGAPVTLGSGFNNPAGVALDGYGNLYIADYNNNAVKVMPVGGGTPITLSAAFSNPYSVVVDALGNLYIADTGHNTLDKMPAAGGTPVTFASGFSAPTGVTIDEAGVIYVSDQLNNAVKSFSPVGGYYVSPFLPKGISFNSSTGTFSGTPTVASRAVNYTVTGYNQNGSDSALVNITIYTPSPVFSYTSPENYAVGAAITPLQPVNTGSAVPALAFTTSTTALGSGFYGPSGVAVDLAGNIYVTDYYHSLVKKIPAGGGSPVSIGSGFSSPFGIAVDGSGNVYVADLDFTMILEIPAGGESVVKIGSGFNTPSGVAVDAAGNVYVSDQGNFEIKKIPAGNGAPVILGSNFSNPYGLAVDGSGNVYVAESARNDIKEIPAGSTTPVVLGTGFNAPDGVAVDGAGNVYVADYGNKAVKMIPAGNGTPITLGSGFVFPADVAIDVKGNVFVADQNNTTVNKISPVGGYFINPGLPAGLSFNSNTGIISGTPTLLSAATNYNITGYDASGGSSAAVSIAVVTVSHSAALSNLQVSNGTLSPAFATGTTAYSASVGYNLQTMTVTPTSADPTATITVNGTAVVSGKPSQYLPLVVGANTVTIVVTAGDGTTKQTYTLAVNEAHSSNNNLAGIKIGSGLLTPAFSASTTSYTAVEPYTTSSITVTPTTADPTATIKINGTTVTSGSASGAIALSVGVNTISIVVTAQNMATKTYTIKVTREAPSTNCNLLSLTLSKGTLTPAFASATINYTDMVTNGTTSLTLTPTGQVATSTITVNGTTVKTGAASGAIALVVGSNAVTTVVTAQDGVTKKTYTVNVIRPSMNAKLSALAISSGTLTPAFNTNTTSYTASVTNTTASITLTPTIAVTGATVKVNGTTVVSGGPSGAITLAVGSNTITTIVTAQDGVTTDTYTLAITRAAPGANIPDAAIGVENFEPLTQLADDGITVHQGISPNGDGINDYLQIDNITNYPNNNLKIMTRNGQLIFEAKGYDNATKVFDGHSNKTGQMQLPGTYFYQLDYVVKGVAKQKTGYLVLKY